MTYEGTDRSKNSIYTWKKPLIQCLIEKDNSFKIRIFRKSHIHKGVMLSANNTVVYTPDISFCSLFSLFLKALTISLGHSKTILIFLMGRLMRKLSITSAECMPHNRKDVCYSKI